MLPHLKYRTGWKWNKKFQGKKRVRFMRVEIRKIASKEAEKVIIECVKVTPQIDDIRAFAEGSGRELTGMSCELTMDEEIERHVERFPLREVYYFEAVDEHVFAYTEKKEYEIRMRLYEIEEQFQACHFVRCSKSVVLNLMKIGSISPALNGRFYAHMKNGERLVISRQYAPLIKEIIMGV